MISILRLTLKGSHAYALFVPILLFLTTSLPVQAQQVQEEWARRFGGSLPSQEFGALMATDMQGNIYVTGTSVGISHPAINPRGAVMVAKYSPEGKEIWRNRFTGDNGGTPRSIAVDAEGNVYVVGSGLDFALRSFLFLAKFSEADGELLWTSVQQSGRYSAGISVHPDRSGGVVVTGSANFLFSGDVSFVSRFHAGDGSLLWTRNLSEPANPANYLRLVKAILGENDMIYLVGTQGRAADTDQAVTMKLNIADGSIMWQQVYDTASRESAHDIGVDAAGSVYAIVSSYGQSSTEPVQSWIIKYATDGTQVWQQEVTGVPSLVLADRSGGLYLSSTSAGTTHISKYNTTTGIVVWMHQYDGTITLLDVDALGDLYVGGSRTGTAYIVSRINAATGERVWHHAEMMSGEEEQTLTDLVVSGIGKVYLTGTVADSVTQFTKLFIASHLVTNGELDWKVIHSGTIPGVDRPAGVVTDAEGNVYVTGTIGPDILTNPNHDIVTFKYSPAGNELWVSRYGQGFRDEASGIAVDSLGNVYVLGTATGTDSRSDLVLLKYRGEDGALVWESQTGEGQTSVGLNLKLDIHGDIYITGSSASMFPPTSTRFIQKINAATGEMLWGKSFTSTAESDVHDIVSFDLDNAGDLYLTGNRTGDAGTSDIGVVKYRGIDGERLWLQQFDLDGRADFSSGLAVDNASGVFVTGFSDYGVSGSRVPVIIKYSASDGQLLWYSQVNDRGASPGRLAILAVDNAGSAYMPASIDGVDHILKFHADDTSIMWAATFDGTLHQLEIGPEGGVYAAGEQNGNIVTTRYQARDGSKTWQTLKESNSQEVLLALDPHSNVIVTGTVFSRETNLDILTVKYSQSGEPICDIPVQVQLYLAPYAIRSGWQVRTTADFGDYILAEDTGVRWTWGDGTAPSISYTAFGTSRITGQHTYEQAGIYRVGLDFTESCLRPANEGYEQWQVIYDPEAGHVVGAGWQNSPQGIYSLMASSGRLNFAFGVRYSGRNATTPQGHLLLQFSNRDLFWSSAVEWLVITGNRAVWKGVGTVQGRGRYGYIVSVQDAGRRGLSDPNDQLRIRIWDMDRGNAIVYDNFELGGEIYNLAGTAGPTIEGGNIVINGRSILDELLALNSGAIAGIEPKEVQAYPNPAHALTTIRFTLAEDSAYELHLYDMRGSLVQKVQQGHANAGATTEVQVDVSALAKGMYLARISSADKMQTVKIVVER